MLMVISPAKTQDYTKSGLTESYTVPAFKEEALSLVEQLKTLSKSELSDLMGVSEKIATLNHRRYRDFKEDFSLKTGKQALLSYKGDVYKAIDLDSFNQADFDFAQEHLRIISGLYGLLRPLDIIQAYRLEMDVNLENSVGSNIYEFWGDKLTEHINHTLEEKGYDTLLNLASNEYFNVIEAKNLKGNLVKITFKENRGGAFRVIGILAKKARGMMTEYIIKNKITVVDELKYFNIGGYAYEKSVSSPSELVFLR